MSHKRKDRVQVNISVVSDQLRRKSLCEWSDQNGIMRHFVFLATLLLAAYFTSSSPIDQQRQQVNRPSVEQLFRKSRSEPKTRVRRSDSVHWMKSRFAGIPSQPDSIEHVARVRRSGQDVKGGNDMVHLKRNPIPLPREQPLETGLRKGEYICENKVCKLQPWDKPTCDICQHPVMPKIRHV